MIIRFLFILLLCWGTIFGAKLPELNSKDVTKILGQIMEAHVSHKQLSPALVGRILESYLEELDPMKCYLTQEEIESWTKPSEKLLTEIKKAIDKEDFSHFEAIHNLMIVAIARRNQIEEKNGQLPLPEKVSIKEFKDLAWAKNKEELEIRLLRLKSLQGESLEKLDEPLRNRACPP